MATRRIPYASGVRLHADLTSGVFTPDINVQNNSEHHRREADPTGLDTDWNPVRVGWILHAAWPRRGGRTRAAESLDEAAANPFVGCRRCYLDSARRA
jgi:hypothetical protein